MLATKESKFYPPTPGSIMAAVKPQLDALTVFMDEQVVSFEPELQDLVKYSLKSQGKRLRPMLVFYSSWGADKAYLTDLVRAAAVLELVHLATLVHDDILDDATLRHNLHTVSEKYGASVAVLLGDALFSQALNLATEFSTVEVCRVVSLATRRVCAGEVRQSFERGNSEFPLEEYFRVIELKTAELFRVSCLLGAQLSGQNEAFAQAAAAFGRYLGIAYQIFDDIADFLGDEAKIGKTLGTDLASGKFTLPMLLLLQKLTPEQRASTVERMKNNDMPLAEISAMMHKHAIFKAVMERFFHFVDASDAALTPFETLAPVPQMRLLSAYVRELAGKLQMT